MSVALHKVFVGFPENAFLYKTCRMWRLSTVFSYFEFLAFVCLFVFFFSYPLLSHPSPLCIQWVTNVATATRYNTLTRTAVLDYIITHWFPQYTLHFSLSLSMLYLQWCQTSWLLQVCGILQKKTPETHLEVYWVPKPYAELQKYIGRHNFLLPFATTPNSG